MNTKGPSISVRNEPFSHVAFLVWQSLGCAINTTGDLAQQSFDSQPGFLLLFLLLFGIEQCIYHPRSPDSFAIGCSPRVLDSSSSRRLSSASYPLSFSSDTIPPNNQNIRAASIAGIHVRANAQCGVPQDTMTTIDDVEDDVDEW